MIFKTLKNMFFPSTETKSNTQQSAATTQSFFTWISQLGRNDLANTTAFVYYMKAYPVSAATDKIAQAIKDITPIVSDENGIPLSTKADSVIKRPNADMSFDQLIELLSINRTLTGEMFFTLEGIVSLRNINVLEPHKMSDTTATGNNITQFIYTDMGTTEAFKLDSDGRYWNAAKTKELIYSKLINPSNIKGRGLSPLSAVSLQIEQYLNSGTHNLARLNNQIKPSIVLSGRNGFVPNVEQRDVLREYLNEFYSGSGNAGNYLITGDFDVTDLNEKTSDMDFEKLTNSTRNAVFQRLGVPITIADTTASTFNNRAIDELSFYDNTIIPEFNAITDLLSFTISRFVKIERFFITFNETDIPALSERALKNLERRSKVGHLTINELRELDSREPAEGGNVIYRPANDVPVATDTFTEDEFNQELEEMSKSYGTN